MLRILETIRGMFGRPRPRAAQPGSGEAEMHVVVPEKVGLPLPRTPQEEMAVPASINGRDLSSGRL